MSPQIFGWIPSNPGGDIVDVLPSQTSGQFTFKISPPDPGFAPSFPPPHIYPTAPSPSHYLDSPSEDTDAEKIPRPKNSFMIFRCEFTRLHHNPQGSRSRRNGLRECYRSVSGRASDAWHSLTPLEKQHYQHLADLEKAQHALDYPHYRYRPKRRENGGQRPPPAASKRRRASPALTIRTAHDTPLGSTALPLSPPADQPPSSPESDSEPLIVDPAIKAGRRRSSSVPVTSGEHQYMSTLWGPQESEPWERPERWERPKDSKRRSRSVTQEWVNMAPSFPPPEPIYFDPRSPQSTYFAPSIYPVAFRALSPGPQFDTLHPATLFQQISPLAAVASSLAGWNGEPVAAPMAPQPVRRQASPWLAAQDAHPQDDHPQRDHPELVLKFEPMTPEFDSRDPLTPLAGDFTWPLDPAAQYFGAGPSRAKAEETEDYGRAEALQNFELGLQERCMVADYALFEENLPQYY